ncbi:stalk domain-containing protein [Tenuibacillus multivorans]|uniref:Copper amine oxidase N-terminal domain-containing protein n=1 Tax=Tenuibacillus multivorans TaxID=237069 RepID=A0A1G9WCZ1_9BACI|nr:stalk domain-containing protein [Tenuibacillus multivorans]GEL76398.1 hypothetical protein TMU01_06330 [Tenuibacillus multivorans]SDM82133.1 Copper amine oxidase N-terminal domain-containing protein [Tenuibacillus multivorans]
MKKFILGLVSGVIIAGGSVVYASDSIEALLFSAKYEINGEQVELPNEYQTLNVDGHAYVPIRFVAESLDSFVTYDDNTKRISIDNKFDLNKNGIRVGQLNVESNENGSTVKGKLYVGQDFWDNIVSSPSNPNAMIDPGIKLDVGGNLLFFDGKGHYLGEVPVSKEVIAKGEQIRGFEVTSNDNLSNYEYVMLAKEFPQPRALPAPPDIGTYDSTGQVGVGGIEVREDNGFSVINGHISLQVDGNYQTHITLTFLDEIGMEIGTAELVSDLHGSNPENGLSISKFETAGKGDLTDYKQVKVTINSLTPIN